MVHPQPPPGWPYQLCPSPTALQMIQSAVHSWRLCGKDGSFPHAFFLDFEMQCSTGTFRGMFEAQKSFILTRSQIRLDHLGDVHRSSVTTSHLGLLAWLIIPGLSQKSSSRYRGALPGTSKTLAPAPHKRGGCTGVSCQLSSSRGRRSEVQGYS